MERIDYTKVKNNCIKVDGGDVEFFIHDKEQKLYLSICNYDGITGLTRAQAKELGAKLVVWGDSQIKKEVINSQFKDVHTEHCCVKHGCKYGEDSTCSVTQYLGPQNSECELCRP